MKNTFTPNSPSSLKYTAFVDVSVGGFGWISLFSQGGDNTNKKYKQLLDGVLSFHAVKGFEVGVIDRGVMNRFTQDLPSFRKFPKNGKSYINNDWFKITHPFLCLIVYSTYSLHCIAIALHLCLFMFSWSFERQQTHANNTPVH